MHTLDYNKLHSFTTKFANDIFVRFSVLDTPVRCGSISFHTRNENGDFSMPLQCPKDIQVRNMRNGVVVSFGWDKDKCIINPKEDYEIIYNGFTIMKIMGKCEHCIEAVADLVT